MPSRCSCSRFGYRALQFAASGLALPALGLALLAAPASATPSISFGVGVRLPAGCVATDETATTPEQKILDCTASPGTTLGFSIIILNDGAGMAGYSFGAEWDQNLEDALTVNSAVQGFQSLIEASAGPPPVTVGFNVLDGPGASVGPGGITQSSASSPGQATNWEALSSSPDSNVNIQTAHSSFRAGRISVTVDATTGTRLQLGWFNSLQDAFVVGSAASLSESQIFFGHIDFNGGPVTSPDNDGDGTPDSQDTDDDNDSWSDTEETTCSPASDPFDDASLPEDEDSDGVCDSQDNCPDDPNTDQSDIDTDDEGDACDDDRDGDAVDNDDDDFPDNGSEWVDTDEDGTGDNADTDDDNDGTLDASDDFPLDATEDTDTDSDGVGDNTDAFPTDPAESADSDSDGVGDNAETACGTNPNLDTSIPLDTDGDGSCDVLDNDDDGDGIVDDDDDCPLDETETTDNDGDGICDNADLDDDNDGTPDTEDAFPFNVAEDTDTDGDGTGNNADSDDDGDGTPDASDDFPLDATEDTDSDGDGIGDNADTFPEDADNDADGDGFGANEDNCPDVFNTPQEDLDEDGLGNACDDDDDGDGTPDASDDFPLDATEDTDTDEDGTGDNADLDDDGDGYSDVEEGAEGTDPLDSESFPPVPEPTSVLLQVTALLTLLGIRRRRPRSS